jgi:hypothetical protein
MVIHPTVVGMIPAHPRKPGAPQILSVELLVAGQYM